MHIIDSYGLNTFAAPAKYELRTTSAQLVIDKNNLEIVCNKGAHRISTPINKLWCIRVKNQISGAKYSFDVNDKISISQENGIIRINSTNYIMNGTAVPIESEFTISVKDDAFCFAGTLNVKNDEWIISELDYPKIERMLFNNSEAGIYWPDGLGKYFNNFDDFEKKTLKYPSAWSTMPWFSLNSKNEGIYFGSHDPLQQTKVFSLEYDKKLKEFNSQISTTIFDTKYSIPDIVIKPYVGEWYAASKFYRNWYDKHFKIVNPPEWVKDNSGWFLAILKQQNMEVMWPYKEIDKLCDIAEQFNLGTIGLFGWGFGGHDHLYPFYTPDNSMGGREELEKAIERAHKRGIRIIIYANGKIMDTSTDFYKYYGHEAMLIQENLQPQIQYYIKQKNSTPVIFAQGCTGSDVWRRTMYNLSLQAASLGADGLLYDQLGVMDASLCFSEIHDHKYGGTDPKYRLQMVNKAREKARVIKSDFIIMTEAMNDYVSKGIDFTHGLGASYAPSQNGFPSLFRYTFPELITTQRNPNPMITRTDANYAAIYGLRHEIESRYPGDVDYLLHGTLPTKESYLNVAGPPNIKKMNMEPAAKATQYVHSLIEFESTNAEFFRRGTFIDEEGIEVKGDDILAKGFINGDKLGVVVWNQHLSEKRNFSITTNGYKLINISEPQKQDIDVKTPLEPNSIRLIVFEKEN